jgi:hypothetical protein
LSAEEASSIRNSLSLTKEFQVVKVTSKKPNYEVGSTSQLKLSFGKKKGEDLALLICMIRCVYKRQVESTS